MRGPKTYGPARRISERPLLIVVGKGDTDGEARFSTNLAVYIANQFALTSDAYTPVVVLGDETGNEYDVLRDYEHNNVIVVGLLREDGPVGTLLRLANSPVRIGPNASLAIGR